MLDTEKYYSSVAIDYHRMYDPALLHDLTMPYPANYIRLQMLKKSFADIKSIIDVGCGDGTPMMTLANTGKRVCGFDLSPQMVEVVGDDRFIVADITKPDTYAPLMEYSPFDGLVCTGVMPHIENEAEAIENMRQIVEPGGKVFVEFRNKLFSLFTLNRLTAEFISEELIEVPFSVKAKEYLSGLVNMTLPPERPYDQMLAKFHNPFEMVDHFENNGFKDIEVLWYHQHPTLPALEKDDPAAYRELGLKMEGRLSWKNPFTCSAFVIEAVKI